MSWRDRLVGGGRRLTDEPTLVPAVGPSPSRHAVAVAHPDWRGIRSATEAQGLPIVLVEDASTHVDRVLELARRTSATVMVLNGFPPGSATLIRAASAAGLVVRCVMHSSMAQHGTEAAESHVVGELIALQRSGELDALAFTKDGQAEAFQALGVPAHHVPARISHVEPHGTVDLGPGTHVGVFAEAAWRKNVTTQVGAGAIMGATVHVTVPPDVPYLAAAGAYVEHGLLPREDFVRLLASVDLNLSVSLFESFPVQVQESYLLGVPCLASRTSSLFRDDPELWSLITVDEHDNPTAIAAAAESLLAATADLGVVERAQGWLERWDVDAADAWARFTDPAPLR